MNSPDFKDPLSKSAPATESAETGLPWFKTWNGVYIFVIASFVIWVGLLTVLTGIFS